MMVMMAQVLVVAMDIPMRSLRISHTQSLVSSSPVVRATRIEPQEMGSLSAGNIYLVNTNSYKYVMFVLPLYKRTKAVCLLKIVPRKFSLKSL